MPSNIACNSVELQQVVVLFAGADYGDAVGDERLISEFSVVGIDLDVVQVEAPVFHETAGLAFAFEDFAFD